MTLSTLYSKSPAEETLLYIFVWYSNVLALVPMVVMDKKCHFPVLLCVVLPVLLYCCTSTLMSVVSNVCL